MLALLYLSGPSGRLCVGGARGYNIGNSNSGTSRVNRNGNGNCFCRCFNTMAGNNNGNSNIAGSNSMYNSYPIRAQSNIIKHDRELESKRLETKAIESLTNRAC